MADQQQKQTQPTIYHNMATGQAQLTVKKRSKECDLKLYGNCSWQVDIISIPTLMHQIITVNSSPFVQKVWIALEMKGIPYQYIEVDPQIKKPDLLLAVDPRGPVPSLRDGSWGCYESNVLLEYVSVLFTLAARRVSRSIILAGGCRRRHSTSPTGGCKAAGSLPSLG